MVARQHFWCNFLKHSSMTPRMSLATAEALGFEVSMSQSPKAAAIWKNLCHIWRDCSKELNWILILKNQPYVAWMIRIGLVRSVFFSFCDFVLHLSLVHWLQWHFRGSRAIDKVQLMDTCHNMLATIFPLYYTWHFRGSYIDKVQLMDTCVTTWW